MGHGIFALSHENQFVDVFPLLLPPFNPAQIGVESKPLPQLGILIPVLRI